MTSNPHRHRDSRLRFLIATFVFVVAIPSTPAFAQVLEADAESFSIQLETRIAAPPGEVWSSLLSIGSWWDGEHTIHGDAEALTLEPVAGGCFCERAPGGKEALHMQVINVNPGEWIWLAGGLGPLQQHPVNGKMTWSLADDEGGTVITLAYRVTGRLSGGLDSWAEPVSGVLDEQLARLRRFVETGRPVADQSGT